MNQKLLSFALVVLLAPALFAQDYAIRLTRPLKAGDQLKISFTAKISQTTSQVVNDAAPQEQKQEVTIQFEGTEKVIEVDANGKETKSTLTVDKFTQTSGDTTTDVAPKGAVIACSMAGKTPTFEIDGKAADPSVAQAIGQVADLSTGQPTDDDIFGTKEHKKKGDSWDMNADLATKSLSESAAGLGMSELAGKTTLDDVTGGTMKISAQLAGKVKPPLPPTVTIDSSTFTAKFGGTFPVDVSKYTLESSQEMNIAISGHVEGPDGKMVVKVTISQSQDRTMTPVK